MQVSQLHAGVCGRPLPVRERVQTSRRSFFCVEARKQLTVKESRIGKAPITVPTGVQFDVQGQTVTVKGNGHEMSETLPDILSIEKLENGTYKLSKNVDTRQADQLHGLFRSLTNNMVLGVSEGFKKELSLIGVGYRASMSGKELNMNLGYSHPVVMEIPENVQVQVVKNTTVIISGHDKVAVGDFAAKVRSKRKPEPYKGKGVRYVDEYVRKKEGKRGK